MNEPTQWTIDQLRKDAATARANFRAERLAEVAAYKSYFTTYATAFRTLVPRVADLHAGTVPASDIATIVRAAESFTALRYLTAPPISDDDLMSLADVDSLAPGTLARNTDHLTAVAGVIGTRRCNVQFVSDSLGLTPKKLQRLLAEEGTSFSDILDDARRAAAIRMVKRSNAPIANIAGLLDYSSTPAFILAFKRWMRMSPTKFRRSGTTSTAV